MRNHFRSNIVHSFAALMVVSVSAGLLASTPVFAQGAAPAASAIPAPTVGKPAPAFSVKDWDGKTRSLSDFKGKTVVLEWFNFYCPFVRKHYDPGNMQSLQKKYTGKGVVWLSVCSSADGKPGWATPEAHKTNFKERNGAPTAVLIDADGTMGRAYGAKTTPHMFVIDKKGVLAYAGAIDDNTSADKEAVKTAKNYVAAALDETLAGKPVSTSATKAYGCSIKYK